jgi:ribosome-binding factor A
MQYRSHRLAEELKNEISAVIAQELHDPRVGFATVTEVKVSPDLRHARILISVFGSTEEKKRTLDVLTSATGFIRKQIGSRIRLRHTPELIFAYDESVERGDRTVQLIDEVNKELGEN